MAGTLRAVLGGWLDLREDVARLNRRLSSADGRCHCRGDPRCACCSTDGSRGPVCPACAEEIQSLAEQVRRVEDDALRYLPAIVALYARTEERRDAAAAVEHGVGVVLSSFQTLRAATDDWATGCRTTHVPAVGVEAQTLSAACDRLHALFTDAPG